MNTINNINKQEANEIANLAAKCHDKNNQIQKNIKERCEYKSLYGVALVREFNEELSKYLNEELSGETIDGRDLELSRNPGFSKFLKPIHKAWAKECKRIQSANKRLSRSKKGAERMEREPKSPVDIVANHVAISAVSSISYEKPFNESIFTMAAEMLVQFMVPLYNITPEHTENAVKLLSSLVQNVLVERLGALDIIAGEGYNASNKIVISEKYAEKIGKINEYEFVSTTVYEPLVVKPQRANNLLTDNSYVNLSSPLLKRAPRVNGQIPEIITDTTRENFPKLFSAIDRQQETAYKVNKEALDYIQEAAKRGLFFDGFHLDVNSVQDKILAEANKQFITAKHVQAEFVKKGLASEVELTLDYSIKKVTAAMRAKARDTMRLLGQASKFANEEEIYFAIFFDHRGRINTYANSTFNYQGNEMGKALLQFAETERPTQAGIKAYFSNLGNALGFDKHQHNYKRKMARAFFNQHKADFMAGNFDYFFTNCGEFDEAITAMVICMDLCNFLKDPEWKSGFICHRDARCSGISINGVIQRELKACELTSTINAYTGEGKLMDAYQEAADQIIDFCVENQDIEVCGVALKFKDYVMTRKAMKHHVMIIMNYGGTALGARSRIEEQLMGITGFSSEQLNEFTKMVMATMSKVAKSPIQYKEFATALGKAAATKHGVIAYRNPMGFPVCIREEETDVVRIETRSASGRRITVNQTIRTGVINIRKCGSTSAPNIVHSWDSNLLLTVWDKVTCNLSTIHDSIGCGVNHVDEVLMAYNEAMYELATTPVIENIVKQIGVDIEIPAVNDMTAEQIEAIRTAKYSLC